MRLIILLPSILLSAACAPTPIVSLDDGSVGDDVSDAGVSPDVTSADDSSSVDSALADGSAASVDAAAVAECESTVDAVHAACAAEEPDAARLCVYDALRPLCRSGRTAFVSGLFHCLLLDACQTPSDPSGARECEAQLATSSATPEDRALGAVLCACGVTYDGCDAGFPIAWLSNFMVLTVADVASLATCLSSAGCDAGSCVTDSPIVWFTQCPNM